MTSAGAPIAEGYVEIRPVLSKSFERDTQQALVNPASKLGKQMGDEVERGAHRGTAALGLLSRTFVSSSAGALGPLQEVADKFGIIAQAAEGASTQVGARLLGIGAAATATGAFLETLASRNEAAQNRLSAAIAATGHDISDYQEQIDKAIESGKHFGYQDAQTLDALNALTIGLHDPKKAIEELGLAQDIAAAKNISLSQAANIVRQAYNGNTRVLKQFGVSLVGITDPAKDLAKAHKDAAKDADALTKAQGSYNDKLLVYQSTVKPTLTQQLALKKSHDEVTKATDTNAAAQARLKKAQDEANTSLSKGDQILQRVQVPVAHQRDANADTFIGRLKTAGAEIESIGAKLGKDIGGPLITIGPALAGVGLIIESGLLPKLASMSKSVGLRILSLGGLRTAATTTAATITAAAAEESAATTGAATTIDEALGRIVSATEAMAAAFTGATPTIAGALEEQAAAAQAASTSIIASSEAASAAMVAEGDAAVAQGGRIAGLGKLGAVGLVGVGVGIGAVSDVRKDPSNLMYQSKAVQQLDTSIFKHGTVPAGTTQATIDALIAYVTSAAKANGGTGATGLAIIAAALAGGNNSADDMNAQRRDRNAGKVATGLLGAASTGKATGKTVGTQTLQAFLDSINGGKVANPIADALAKSILAGKQSAVSAAQTVADAAVQKFHDAVTSSKQLQLQVAQTVTQGSTLADAFSGASSGIPNAFGDRPAGGTGVKGVESFLHQRAVMIARFAKALTSLRKKGLDQRLISEIAQLGTDQGLPIAEELLAGSAADVRLINTEEQQIARAANVVGKKIADSQYGGLISADKANADRLVAKLNELKAELKRLNGSPKSVSVTAHSTGASAAQIGAEAGRAVTLAMKGM